MKCGRCGVNNPENADKCMYCGAVFIRPKKQGNGKKPRNMTDNIILGVIIALVAVLLVIGGVYAYNNLSGKRGFSGGGGGGGGFFSSAASYKITFNFNYDNLPIEEQTVNNGEYAQSPVINDREGFVFGGWYEDPELTKKFDFLAPVRNNYNLTAYWIDMTDLTDTDGDGLTDNTEQYYGTDKTKVDTDGDGLSDYHELAVLTLDPLNVDTNGNGKTDGDEDADSDKLTNLEEITIGCDPTVPDTDSDGLTDEAEFNNYKTDSVNVDTDGDGLSDGKEIELGTDPLVAEQNFNVSVSSDEKDIVKPTVSVNLSGEQVESLKIEKIKDEKLFPETIPGYMGAAYDFSVDGNFESATISFEFNPAKGDDPVIYYFNDEGLLEPLETTVNGNVASTQVSHFSTYILINRKIYEESFTWEDAWVVNSNYTGVEIVLVIDDSGSMKTSDENNERLSVAKTLVNSLPENSKVGVVRFESDTEILTPSLTDDKTAANGFLTTNYFKSSGGTYMYSAIDDAMGLFESTGTDIMKLLVVLSDGATSDMLMHNSIVSSAVSRDIRVYTVGLGSSSSSYFTSFLKPLANDTGAAFYLASNASELTNIYKDISKKIDIETDSDVDGIPDYYEENMILFNGVKMKLDKSNPDTDGDGVPDGKEIELIYIYKDNKTKVSVRGRIRSYPDSVDSDNDGINDADDSEPLGWNVSDRDLAMFAALTYKRPEEYNSRQIDDAEYFSEWGSAKEVYDSWDIVDCSGDLGAGIAANFFATTYKNGNDVVIAYRGTDGEWGEWMINVFGVGLLNFHSEELYARLYAAMMARKYSDCNIYITGHSLGGYLAQIGASEIICNYNSNVLKKVVYFNGIGLKFNLLLYWSKNTELNALSNFYNGDNLISYYIYGDVVSSIGRHSGDERGYEVRDEILQKYPSDSSSPPFYIPLTRYIATWMAKYAFSSLKGFVLAAHEIDNFFYYLN